MNSLNSFSIIWILFTIALLVVGFIWIDDVNAWAGKYTDFINLNLALIGLLVLPVITWMIKGKIDSIELQRAKKLIKVDDARNEYVELSNHDRELFRENYQNVSEALALFQQDGRVNDEAMRLIWKAQDQARLELPYDIMEFTENLRAIAQKAWSGHKVCWDRSGQPQSFVGKQGIMSEMHAAEKKLYDIQPFEAYRPHMAITDSNKQNQPPSP